MKTLALLLALALALAYALPAQAQDARRPSEAMTVAAYEAKAVSKARQRPDVIRLRFALAKAATDAEKKALSSSLYAVMDAAAAQGRQAGLAAVEAQRRESEAMHRRRDEDRRHDELLNALRSLRR